MNDDNTLTAVRDRLGRARDHLDDVRMGTPASTIFAAASKRRTRRGVTAVAAACVAAGLATGLALPSGGSVRHVHVHLAAWSVDTSTNGTVTFTLNNTSRPGQLEHTLAAAGVPATVRFGQICRTVGQHDLLPTQGFLTEPGVSPANQMGSVFILAAGHHSRQDPGRRALRDQRGARRQRDRRSRPGDVGVRPHQRGPAVRCVGAVLTTSARAPAGRR
jgi:hypothetical protein